jgi:predicted nucleic acid-binding protein
VKVVDTSVAVDHLRGMEAATELLAVCLRSGDHLVASELVRFELLVGVQQPELPALESFFTALTWVPLNEELARTAARLARRYRRSHGNIDDVDYLIAATALVLDADLLTTNVAHFPMFEGLQPAY